MTILDIGPDHQDDVIGPNSSHIMECRRTLWEIK